MTALLERRGLPNAGWVAALVLICAGIGVAGGVSPRYGIAAALGLAFVVIVFADLLIGVALFAFLSFLDIINVGGSAVSFEKVVGLLIFASWIAHRSTRPRANVRAITSRHPGMIVAIVFFVGWSLLSAAWAASAGTAAVTTYRDTLDLLLIPIVYTAVKDRNDLQVIIIGYLCGAIFSAAYGLLFPPSPMSLAAGRLTGSIGDANQQATVLVAAIALAIGLAATARRAPSLKLLAFAAIGLSFVGLLNTLSRGGLVAFGVVLVAGVLFGGRWRRSSAVLLVVGLVALGVYFTALAPSTAVQRVTSSDTSGRSTLWTVGWRMFKANPVVGVGAGNFQVSSVHYLQQPGLVTAAVYIIDIPKVAHNIYLEQLATLGIPGLIAMLAIFVSGVSAALKAAHIFERLGDRELEIMSRCVILALFAFLTADFFVSDLLSKQLWIVFALAPALLKLADIELHQVEPPPTGSTSAHA